MREAASGEAYETYLRRELLEGIDAPSIGYVLGRCEAPMAAGYIGTERFGRPTDHAWATDGPWWNLRGNGGILATAEDLWRWHRALTSGRVLPQPTSERLVQPYVARARDARPVVRAARRALR